MRYRHLIFGLILTLSSLAGTAAAAPKVDPQLAARLSSAQSAGQQLCVILTFHGDQVTDAQVGAVSALGITTGLRMANFPIMAVNATPAQIRQMIEWDSLCSIYLNTPLQLNMNQTKPLIGVTRLRQDDELTRQNGNRPSTGRGITIAINDTGVDGTHADLKYDPLNPAGSKIIQNVIINPNDKDGLVVRTDATGNPVNGILPPTYVENVITSDTNGGHGTHVASIAAGAGLANVHAAVDLALNPQKPYGSFGFTGKGLALNRQDGGTIDATVAQGATNQHSFSVPANALFTFVQLEWGAAAGEDKVIVDNTRLVLNDLTLTVNYRDERASPQNQTAQANQINLGGLFGSRETVKLEFPLAGTATAEISGGLIGEGAYTDQPYRLTITHYLYDPNEAGDLSGLDAATKLRAYRLIYDRMMFAAGGAFRPGQPLTRMEPARALMFGARVMQYIPNQPSFTDIAAGTPDALVAESLKREGLMGTTGATFGPTVSVNRLEEAVALVRALRLTAQADALKNTDVKAGGQTIIDNAKVPGDLRGYVQLAIDRGLMEAFPAETRVIGPGQIQVIPGPRFEPDRTVNRAEFVNPMTRLLNLIFGE